MAASVLIPTERRPTTMPAQPSATWMLKKLNEVSEKLDKSLEQGRENGEQIRALRIELGLDGVHGRLPRLEEDFRKAVERLDNLEESEHVDRGKMQVKTVILSFLTSSAAAGALGVLAKMLGLIH